MPTTNRFLENLSRAVTAAGAMVTTVEFINLFRQETGIKKELYCKNEDKITSFVSISWNDLHDIRRKAVDKNLPILETLPSEKDIVLMRLNPFAQKPYICLSCSNMKLE